MWARKRDNEFPRITFAETVEKIVGLLNEAINSIWPGKAEKADDGRMTSQVHGIKVQRYCNGQPVRPSTQTPNGIRKQTIYLLRKLQRPTLERCRQTCNLPRKLQKQWIRTEFSLRKKRTGQDVWPIGQAYYNRGGTEEISTRQDGPDVHSSFIGQRYYSGPYIELM